MKSRLRPSRRTRLRLTLLAVLALLFQQVALASYVCASPDMSAGGAAMRAHCDGMPMAQQKQATALCPQHWAQQASVTQDARLPNVPPLALPAMLPPMPGIVALPLSRASPERDAPWRSRGIPPALRFRVLLI
jgi:hypothetical protein